MKESYEEISARLRQFETVREWLTSIGGHGSRKTTYSYLKNLDRFCQWTKKNPDELIAEAEMKIDMAKTTSERIRAQKYAENLVLTFTCNPDGTGYMEKELGLKRKTCVQMYGTLRSFYRQNGIYFYGKTPKQWSEKRIELPKKEEMREVLRHCDLRERVIILGLRDLGTSREDFARLTYGDIKEDYESGSERLLVGPKLREKDKVWWCNCFGPEATREIGAYLEERKRKGEVFTDETPLVIQKEGRKVPEGTIVAITSRGISQILEAISKRSGILITSHYFRKWWKTKAKDAGVDRDRIDMMGAWKVPGVTSSYDLPAKEQIFIEHAKAEPFLSFETIVDMEEQQKTVIVELARKWGYDVDPMKLKKMSIKDLTSDVEKYTIRGITDRRFFNGGFQGGGLNSEQVAAKVFADIIVKAVKLAEERLQK